MAYALSYFHFLTHNRLDLWQIYEQQKIDNFLSNELKKILIFVYNHLVEGAKNSLISEYAKRSTSWEKLKSIKYSEDLETILHTYLISEKEKLQRDNEKEIDSNNVEDTIFLISEIQKLGLKFWDGFKHYLKDHSLEGFDYMLAFEIFKKMKDGQNFTAREITIGKKVIDFLREHPLLIEKIKGLSTLEEKEMIEVKVIYDRLLLLTKDDWKRIIDLATQTNLFNNLELANVKSVQSSLMKKTLVKEQALIKAFESIKKLKKFGINI